MKQTLYLIFIFLVFVFFGDLFYTTSPFELDANALLLAPSFTHPFGTDRLGRDILARIIAGGKVSIVIGFFSALIGSFIGLFVGLIAGYFRGLVDKWTVIVIDLFLTFPTFFLLLTLISYVDASVLILIVVISITSWMMSARMIRSEAFAVGSKPFVKILKVAKVSFLKIIFKYYTPLIAPIFLISFTFGVSGAILAESALSFLGLGIMPPNISWGLLLSEGKEIMDIAPWVSFFPGLFIFFVSYLLITLSDKLQSKINAKSQAIT